MPIRKNKDLRDKIEKSYWNVGRGQTGIVEEEILWWDLMEKMEIAMEEQE